MAGNQYKQFLKRLEALEKVARPEPLIVQAEKPDGSIDEMPMTECYEQGYKFVRIVSGGSGDCRDLDLLLKQWEEAAWAAANDDELEGVEENVNIEH